MKRTWLFSAMLLTLAFGLSPATASAKDHDNKHDRAKWEHERRERQRHEFQREHHEQEAMHRWDREHHRHPMVVQHHEPKHEGWDRGHKTGWHNGNVPPRHPRSYPINHHYDRHRIDSHRQVNTVVPNRPGRNGYSNQQVESREARINARTGPVVR